MSYYKELKNMILELRGGGFFLSPRDIWFLKFLEEEGYPIEVVKEGIRKFFLFYPPKKRAKLPIFMSFGQIKKLFKYYRKKAGVSEDWKERFRERLNRAEQILGKQDIKEPEDIKEAEELLQEMEKKIANLLWKKLEREEREEILKKFRAFSKEEELLKAMVKHELFKRAGIKSLSLFLN